MALEAYIHRYITEHGGKLTVLKKRNKDLSSNQALAFNVLPFNEVITTESKSEVLTAKI